MRPTNTRKRTAVAAGLTILCSCSKQHNPCISSAFTPTSSLPLAFTNNGRGNLMSINRRPSLFARKKQQDKLNNNTKSNTSSSAKKSKSSSIIEEVKPLSSVSQEKRLRAIEALAAQQQQQQRAKKKNSIDDPNSSKDPLLLQNMDAAAMLLETFTQATTNTEAEEENNINGRILNGKSNDNINGNNSTSKKKKTQKKKSNSGSVPGATSMTTIRQQAATEGGYSLSPRDTKDLYREDGSNKNRWAVDSLIEKLDERIRDSGNDDVDTSMDGIDMDGMGKVVEAPKKKRGRGRPRKNPVPVAVQQEIINGEVVKVQPIKAAKKKKKQFTSSKATTKSNPAYLKDTDDNEDTIRTQPKKIKAKAGRPRAVKGTETLIGASAIVNNKRQRRATSVKSLPGRRDENGNIIPPDGAENKKIKGDGRIDSNRRQLSNDSLNLNRYYQTELLSAKEEYSLGMKVKFMVKCEAVHEGLSLQLDRLPTIAEWASACGFDTYDAEMCSESYVDNELDKQIRPSGSEVDELDPNMFVGNGLVNDTGVGRGKGRAKKPPPTQLADFYDDSYEKFKKKESVHADPTDAYDEEDEEDGEDIFLYRQKISPGGPINRGSPRIFREMMLTAKEAKQRMVECNMRLVVSIARRYHGVGVNVQDLVQEGSLGLARAAEKFDPKKGFKFSTYASWWIQQAVFRSIAYHSRTIRLPVHVHNLLNKVRRARQIMQQELGRMPTNEEMAEEMDMSIEKYNKMIRNTRNALSLENPKYKNNPKDLGHESDVLVGDMVDSSVIFDEKTPEQMVDNGLLHSDIQYMLGKLGDDERIVLCLRYGINDGITRTVTLVASEMRQTKSWVRSQECRALRKLRRPWYEKRLNEHRQSLSASGLPL